MNFYDSYIKRLMDAFLSILGLMVLAPLFLILAFSIKLDSKGPVFFAQDRVGKKGKVFKIFKFRTMRIFEESFNPDGSEMENYARVTRVGRFLRKTSIDELPQLINILLGNMSIVGPRPTLPYQVEKYSDYQKRRLLVRPGLTGLAQVSGRNSLSWEEKIELDIRYVESVSFVRDLSVILKTVPVVFKAEKQEFVKHDSISEHKGGVLSDVGAKENKSGHGS